MKRSRKRMEPEYGSPRSLVQCRSTLDWEAFTVLLAMSDAESISAYPSAIDYVDRDGVRRSHAFEVCVNLRNGKRLAVMVRTKEVADELGLESLIKEMASHISSEFADALLLITDADCDRDTVHNAELIVQMRHIPDPEADAAIAGLIGSLNGFATIRCLVDMSGLGARAFGALVRMIGDGVLELTNSRRIVHEARVRRTGVPG